MKDKLIQYILTHFEGMQEFRKQYENITDKMLIEDARMLLKLFPNKKLTNLLNKFIGDD